MEHGINYYYLWRGSKNVGIVEDRVVYPLNNLQPIQDKKQTNKNKWGIIINVITGLTIRRREGCT